MAISSEDHIGERWCATQIWHRPVDGAPPDAYGVADRFDGQSEGPEFATQIEADREADRRNFAEAEATMDPAFAERRKRLRALGETFRVRYGDGPKRLRWPSQPGRYAVETFSERYNETFWETVNSREELEAEIREGAALIVDLDTGENIPFDVTVTVHLNV